MNTNLTNTQTMDRLLTDVEVAELRAQSVCTIRKERLERRGPVYFRLGRSVRYRLSDVVAWMEARKVSGDAA